MQKFELVIDHSIEYFRKQGILTGDRIRDKTYHSFGNSHFAAKRDESLFDFWLFNGKFLGIEAKQTAEKSLPYKNVKDHQVENLNLINSLGGIGIFLINFHSTKRTPKNNRIDVVYALNIDDYIKYKEENDRSSIPLEYVQEKGCKINSTQVGFTKPRKSNPNGIPKPIIGLDLTVLKEWIL